MPRLYMPPQPAVSSLPTHPRRPSLTQSGWSAGAQSVNTNSVGRRTPLSITLPTTTTTAPVSPPPATTSALQPSDSIVVFSKISFSQEDDKVHVLPAADIWGEESSRDTVMTEVTATAAAATKHHSTTLQSPPLMAVAHLAELSDQLTPKDQQIDKSYACKSTGHTEATKPTRGILKQSPIPIDEIIRPAVDEPVVEQPAAVETPAVAPPRRASTIQPAANTASFLQAHQVNKATLLAPAQHPALRPHTPSTGEYKLNQRLALQQSTSRAKQMLMEAELRGQEEEAQQKRAMEAARIAKQQAAEAEAAKLAQQAAVTSTVKVPLKTPKSAFKSATKTARPSHTPSHIPKFQLADCAVEQQESEPITGSVSSAAELKMLQDQIVALEQTLLNQRELAEKSQLKLRRECDALQQQVAATTAEVSQLQQNNAAQQQVHTTELQGVQQELQDALQQLVQQEEHFQAEKTSLLQQVSDARQLADAVNAQLSQSLSTNELLQQQLETAETQLQAQQAATARRISVSSTPSSASDIKQRSRDLNERELQLDQKYQTLIQREKQLLAKQHASEADNAAAREERQRQAEKLMLREERVRAREAQLARQQQELTERSRPAPLQRTPSNSQKLVRRTSSGVWPQHDEKVEEVEQGRSRKRQRMDEENIAPARRTPSHNRQVRRSSFISSEADLMKGLMHV